MLTDRDPMDHELKCWPEYFQAVKSGIKNFEVRKWDRPYRVGDTVRLREWDTSLLDYTGEELQRTITYLLDLTYLPGDNVPHFAGYVVMSLSEKGAAEMSDKELQEIIESHEFLQGKIYYAKDCTGRPEVIARIVNIALRDVCKCIDHIAQLQAENSRLKDTNEALKNSLINAEMNLEHITEKLAAAVEDMKVGWLCRACKKRVVGQEWSMCKQVKYINGPEKITTCDNFEWRGTDQPEVKEKGGIVK